MAFCTPLSAGSQSGERPLKGRRDPARYPFENLGAVESSRLVRMLGLCRRPSLSSSLSWVPAGSWERDQGSQRLRGVAPLKVGGCAPWPSPSRISYDGSKKNFVGESVVEDRALRLSRAPFLMFRHPFCSSATPMGRKHRCVDHSWVGRGGEHSLRKSGLAQVNIFNEPSCKLERSISCTEELTLGKLKLSLGASLGGWCVVWCFFLFVYFHCSSSEPVGMC